MTQNAFFNQHEFLDIMRKYWKPLAMVALLAAIVSYVFSGPRFIKPHYRSFAVVYPVNLSPYSTETQTEQLLQLLNSDDLKDSLIHRFDLMQHYRINDEQPFAHALVLDKLNRRLKIDITRFESVKIEATDTDPEVAYALVNELLAQLNTKIRTIYRKQFREVYTVIQTQMDLKRSELDSLDNRLRDITVDYELFDVPVQANEVVRGYLGTVDGSNGQFINHESVLKFMANIINYGAEHIRTSGYAYTSRNEYLNLKNQFENAQKEITKELTYVNVVTNPRIPLLPAYHIRPLVVFFSTISALFLAFIMICILRRINHGNIVG
nr:hypothetical protein [Bacteroidota bacterium]